MILADFKNKRQGCNWNSDQCVITYQPEMNKEGLNFSSALTECWLNLCNAILRNEKEFVAKWNKYMSLARVICYWRVHGSLHSSISNDNDKEPLLDITVACHCWSMLMVCLCSFIITAPLQREGAKIYFGWLMRRHMLQQHSTNHF